MFYEDAPPWRTPDDLTITDLRGKISTMAEQVRSFNIGDALDDVFKILYLTDMNRTMKYGNMTKEAVELALKIEKPVTLDGRVVEKIRCTLDCYHFCSRVDEEMAKEMVKRLGETGDYRRRPRKYKNIRYASPEEIAPRMKALFQRINRDLGVSSISPYEIGTYFFAEFLLISPFENRNKCVARFILSKLLLDEIVAPVIVFPSEKHPNHDEYRDMYDNRLLEVQNGNSKNMCSLIIQSCYETLEMCLEMIQMYQRE